MIEVKNLTKYYGKGESRFKVLDNINLKIAQGDFAVILGASGSGKSTLLNVLSGLEKADSGEVCLDGKDICSMSESERTKFRRDNVGFIFQQYYLLPNMNVDKNVRMGADLASNSDYRKIISAVGLDDKVKKYPGELSGGEQQRVAIARALAKKPTVLFLDEPTGALDSKAAKMLLERFNYLNHEHNATIIMVTHDSFTASYASRVIFIKDGKIFNEISRGADSRKQFFDKIINVVTLLGGDVSDAL